MAKKSDVVIEFTQEEIREVVMKLAVALEGVSVNLASVGFTQFVLRQLLSAAVEGRVEQK